MGLLLTPAPPFGDGVVAVRVGHEVVAWVPSTGALHLVDATGTHALEVLLSGVSTAQAPATIAADYQVPEHVVRADVLALLDRLVSVGVLELPK